jgi:hypothetical protein
MVPTAQELPLVTLQEHEKDTLVKNAHSSADPTLEYIRSLTNVADIQECLRQLEQEENKVDADLDELLAEREELEASLDKLEVLE